ncbi:hypothetical protein MGM_02058 [Candida albicans P75063]|nr:hypothetical protein MGM_02058 [Candida albicans P75063]
MSGSSRSLLKAIETLFLDWPDDEKQKEHRQNLDEVMTQYLDKHNNLATLLSTTSMNDELYVIYDKYIKPSEDILREYVFLDILKEVSSVFNIDEINLWLRTYLKPALDSAGYFSQFVDKARDLIRKIAINYLQTNDESLNFERGRIGSIVMHQIMEIYLNNNKRLEYLNLESNDSQSYQERVRFIKFNCLNLLQEYGLKHISNYTKLLDQHLKDPTERLETLNLFSKLVATQSSQVSYIIESDLFSDLLKCLLYDFNDASVFASATVLVMLIPQVSTKLGQHLPDLFAIYLRLVNWHELNKYVTNRYELFMNYMSEDFLSWKIDNTGKEAHATEIIFDWQYYGTLLYGLFVLNFIEFSAAPLKYLQQHKPKLITLVLLEGIEANIEHATKMESFAIAKSKEFLQSLLLHPKMISLDTSQQRELEAPVEWILQQNTGSISSEDIAISCLSLNPHIMADEAFKRNNIPPDLWFSKRDSVSQNESHHLLSRNSSLAGPMYINVKESHTNKLLSQQAINGRKMSIIPTNLMIEDDSNNGVKFKEVKFSDDNISDADISFNGGSSDNIMGNSSLSLRNFQENHKTTDPIPELLSTHEKLYAKQGDNDSSYNDDKKSVNNFINDKGKYELRLSRPISSPTTNVETSSVFKASPLSNGVKNNADTVTLNSVNIPKTISGTAIDFYQRELLLYKNELEFSSYMKHLNKFYYLKLKQNKQQETVEARVDTKYESLKVVLDETKEKLTKLSTDHDEEKKILIKRLEDLNLEKEKLTRELNDTISKTSSDLSKYDLLIKDVIPTKDYEIENLKLKLSALEEKLKERPEEMHTTDSETTTQSHVEVDATVYDLRTKLQLVNEKYNQTTQELKSSNEAYDKMVKKYEEKLKTSKLNLHENLNSFTKENEKKIQDLLTTILKYENLLEEKNSKILQLSSSKPISIPIGTPRPSTSSNKSSRHDSYDPIFSSSAYSPSQLQQQQQQQQPSPHHHHSGNDITAIQHSTPMGQLSSSYFPPQPIRNNSAPITSTPAASQQAIPIIRGRGGYQKRSKKLM